VRGPGRGAQVCAPVRPCPPCGARARSAGHTVRGRVRVALASRPTPARFWRAGPRAAKCQWPRAAAAAPQARGHSPSGLDIRTRRSSWSLWFSAPDFSGRVRLKISGNWTSHLSAHEIRPRGSWKCQPRRLKLVAECRTRTTRSLARRPSRTELAQPRRAHIWTVKIRHGDGQVRPTSCLLPLPPAGIPGETSTCCADGSIGLNIPGLLNWRFVCRHYRGSDAAARWSKLLLSKRHRFIRNDGCSD
jgi:hypothetical protein